MNGIPFHHLIVSIQKYKKLNSTKAVPPITNMNDRDLHRRRTLMADTYVRTYVEMRMDWPYQGI